MNSTYVKAQLLLGAAIVCAIAFVGCIYELSSGEPDWGVGVTWTILGISLPACIALFTLAVQLARASMENNP